MRIKTTYIPESVGSFICHMALMATNAPQYKGIYDPVGDPEWEFARTRSGLENIRTKIGEKAYAYLAARIEENWRRLQTGDPEDLRQLKLSFGEMEYFLETKKYKDGNITDDLVEHTSIR
jgi:hypothetical protein